MEHRTPVRPDLDDKRYYNVIPEDFDECEPEDIRDDIWAERSGLPLLTLDEIFDVYAELVEVLQQFGDLYDPLEQPTCDFLVWDDKIFDRTQRVEMKMSERLTSQLPEIVRAVQGMLYARPLWRVAFLGTGGDNHWRDNYFMVYPETVLSPQSREGLSQDEALLENARLRLSYCR